MGNPVRVLHCVVNMNRGGAEILLMNLYRNIDRSKVQFDFLTCKEGEFDEEIKRLGGIIHRIPYITEIGHFRYKKALNEFFKNHQHYQIVHSHMDKMSGFVLAAANKNDLPIRIAHSHNTSSEGNLAIKLYKWYAGTHLPHNATHYYACSTDAANWLFKKHANKAHILKNGIETEKFNFSSTLRKKTRRRLGLDSYFVIGHVGRFQHQKNHPLLIDLFATFEKDNPNTMLVLVGDGPLRKEMEQLVEQKGLKDKVLFLGVRKDIHELLQSFDLFLFPSIHEGLPVTLVEAQGAGLPCLVSDVITKEVDMDVGLIDYCSIKNKKDWLHKMQIYSKVSYSRQQISNALLSRGYDIKESTNWCEQFYLRTVLDQKRTEEEYLSSSN